MTGRIPETGAASLARNFQPVTAISPTRHPRSPLCKCVSIGYTAAMAGKDAGLRIRVERELRDEFLEICRAQDRPAAQVIREFMRRYVSEHETGREPGRKLPVDRGDQR
jgi:hypothetical protein